MTRFFLLCLPLLLSIASPALSEDSAVADIDRALQSLALDDLLTSLQPLVERTLAQTEETPLELRRAIAGALSGSALQRALLAELEQRYRAQVYRRALAVLQDPAIAAAQTACEETQVTGLSDELLVYQSKLAERSPRPLRVELAQQMDRSARTSLILAYLYGRVERIIVEASRPELAAQVPWSEVYVQRRQSVQQSALTWFLYCGRYAGDEVLRQWIAHHDDDSVQKILDDYYIALTLVLDQAAQDITQSVAP